MPPMATILKLTGPILLIALALSGGMQTRQLMAAADRQVGGAAGSADVDPRVVKLKALVDADVSSPAMFDLGQQMNDMVFSFGEIGFQEFETQKYLGRLLRENGFTVQDGVAGIPTAWVARWGSGQPVIAFGSDIDGIPQGSQKPGVAYHDPMVEGAPGHGEGHNSGTPLNIVAALAVKRVMERETSCSTTTSGATCPRAGATAAAAGSSRWSTPSTARPRTAPARRGAAAPRSMPWS